jgi:hypothetical protein
MELPLAEVRNAAGQRAEWVPAEDGTIDLRLACEHPALHDVFENLVDHADRVAREARSQLNLPPGLTAGLPRGFTASELRAQTSQDDVPAYDVPLSRFQIAEEKVRELLMGRQLYGDPKLAIRELYQNALDACRWRATRQKYLTHTGSKPGPWEGLIRFEEGTDEDGRPYIDCEDNGVGMDLNTLKHVFANAGERFVYGQEFRAEQAAWAELDPPLQMIPNSQFGVGVFSYFMLADEITVTTRHQRSNGVVAPEAHEVRIASSGSLLQIRPAVHDILGGGTRIRMYLSGDARGVSAMATLQELLWLAEHRVVVNGRYGRQEIWEPGELRYQGTGVRPLKCGEDLWWVPGQGDLAADGIATGAGMFGLVVNLRGQHRPQFTVDRKTLRSFDANRVDTRVEASLPDLMGWPGFTLTWLWQMSATASRHPWVRDADLARSQRIFEYAAQADKYLAVYVDDASQDQPVPLRVAGCVAVDDAILTARSYSSGSDTFKAWRGGVWRQLDRYPVGLVGLLSDEKLLSLAPERIAGFPVPDPIDGAMFGALAQQSSGEGASTWAMLTAAAKFCRTPRDGLRRWRRYAITGIDLSGTRGLSAIDVALSEDDVKLITALPAWATVSEHQHDELVRTLVEAALKSQRSPGTLLHRTQALKVDGWFSADADRARLLDEAALDADQIWRHIQARDLGWLTGWLDKGLAPTNVAALGERPGQSVGQVVESCAELARLGLTIPNLDIQAYPTEFEVIELTALREVFTQGAALSMADLMLVAADAGVSLGTAHDALARLEEHGILVRPHVGGHAAYVPSSDDVELITRKWPADERRVLLAETRSNQRSRLWMRVAQIITRRRGRDENLLPSAEGIAPIIAPSHSLTFAELAEASWVFEMPLAGTASALGKIYPHIQIPALPADCRELILVDGIHKLLLDTSGDEISWRQLLPEQIVSEAISSSQPLGDLITRLAAFRALGGQFPECAEAARKALNELRLDKRDSTMLTAGNFYVLAVWPLHLVQTAGRFGWTLSQTHQRFAQLTPIGLRLDYPQVELPDEIVYWHDILALTTHFDGQEPVISGRIEWSYLEHAAEQIFDVRPDEIPAKAAFLRDRLTLYARLFELELPDDATIV